MAFVVFTAKDEPFIFEGKIAGTEKDFVFKDRQSARIYKTDQVVAVMRQDFAEEYGQAMEELRRLKYGDPTHN